MNSFSPTIIFDGTTSPTLSTVEYSLQYKISIRDKGKFYAKNICVRFIAEESTGKDLPELTDDPTWIIDPIDGTTNFIHRFPHTCVVIGLAIKKEMVIGIVYNPILEELFTARRGHGALLNGKPIRVSEIQGKDDVQRSFLKEERN